MLKLAIILAVLLVAAVAAFTPRGKQRLRYWLRPIRCPEPGCGLRCLSKPGLGRHRAAHARAKQQVLPLPVAVESDRLLTAMEEALEAAEPAPVKKVVAGGE